jgi:hypothetical protein
MRYFLAILCALAVVITQTLYGGAMRPVFALPGLLLVGVAGVVALMGITWKGLPSPSVPGVLSVAALAGWLIWRCLESPDPWLAAGYLRLIVGCFVLYLVFSCAVTNPFHRLAFLGILLVAALLQAALAAWQFARPAEAGSVLPWLSEQLREWYGRPGGYRGKGTYLNGNHLVWFLNVAGVFALAAACWGRWGIKTRIVLFYAALSCIAGSIITLSRGGFLGLCAALVVFLFLSSVALAVGAKDRRWVLGLGIAAAALAIGGVMFWFFRESFAVQARFDTVTEDSYRPQVFDAVARQFQLSPITGTGAGSFVYFGRIFKVRNFPHDDIYAHNDWAQLAADFGAPAALLALLAVLVHAAAGFSGLITVLRRRMAVHSKPQSHAAALGIGTLAALAAFSIHSFFDFNMQIPASALLASACLGMVVNLGVKDREFTKGWTETFRILCCLGSAAAGAWLMVLTFRAALPEWTWLQAENAIVTGRPADALRWAGDAPDHPALQRLRGEALLEIAYRAPDGNSRRALALRAAEALRIATAASPWEARGFLLLADAERTAGRYDLARAAALEAIKRAPLQGRSFELVGETYLAEGRLPEALQAFSAGSMLAGNIRAYRQRLEVERKLRILEAEAK